MGRPGRVFFDGAVYHVYNRLARGERVFDDDGNAKRFCELLRDMVERDGLTVFAWALLSNHYHLAVRTSQVSLDRPMRSLQQRLSRDVNVQMGVFGPLWQGRYRAKLVTAERYLDQLLVYIHLNPVAAGLVTDPAEFRWSGHREIIGQSKSPIADVDEVLRVFGKTRGEARAAYVRRLKGAAEEEWVGEDPGRLPWWGLGRPAKSEEEDPEEAIRGTRRQRAKGVVERPSLDSDELLRRGAVALGVTMHDLKSRLRGRELVHAREVLSVLAVERYGIKVVDVARGLEKSPDTITKAISRCIRQRAVDPELRTAMDLLDQVISGAGVGKFNNNGGMA